MKTQYVINFSTSNEVLNTEGKFEFSLDCASPMLFDTFDAACDYASMYYPDKTPMEYRGECDNEITVTKADCPFLGLIYRKVAK